LLIRTFNADCMSDDIVFFAFVFAAILRNKEVYKNKIRFWWHVITGPIKAGDPIACAVLPLVIEFWFWLRLSLSLICGNVSLIFTNKRHLKRA